LRARYHEKRVLFKVDAVVANSCYTARSIESGYGLDDIKTIYKSCNTSIFSRQGQSNTCEKSFLFVANDWRKKGLVPLLSAIAKLQRVESSRIKLTVVGTPDRDYNSVVKLVDGFKLSEVVTIRGNLPSERLAEEYCNHRYLVAPAYIEALGISILEAMSCGLVVAVADRGGMTEIVDDGVNGFVFEHPTSEAIYATLRKMLQLSQMERTKILVESDKTLRFFNSTRMVNEVSALYNELFAT
jgi:glycosyltransferase involved in cell wall biosynthesis